MLSFKQKTAYEMSLCDWSSDVCSSDLFTFCHKDGVICISEAIDISPGNIIYHYLKQGLLGEIVDSRLRFKKVYKTNWKFL